MPLRIEIANAPQAQIDMQRLEQAVYACDSFHIHSREPFPAEGVVLIAYEGEQPIAHCCARRQTANPDIGTIGSFEALENTEAAQTLLESAIQWLREQGAKRIIGPMDGDTWHPYRFNTGPFNGRPFIKEPWNPPYYPALWAAAGFSIAETYDSFVIDDPAKAATNQSKYYRRCCKSGYTFAPITAANYVEMLPIIYELSCRIFDKNILYTPIAFETFKHLYLPAKPLLKDGLSWIASHPSGIPCGYVFTFPDYAEALCAMRGQSGPLAKLRFVLNKRKATRTCIKTLGVTPETRGSGLSAALTWLSFQNSLLLGYRQAIMCLMHSSNDSRRFGGQADRLFRSYALYEYLK